MNDPLEKYLFYKKACELFESILDDSSILGRDYRSMEIVKQLVRSGGSIAANIKEGYGRGTRKEFIYFLTVACGSARESRGWYIRSKRFINSDVISRRLELIDEIISLLVSSIKTLKQKGAGE